MGQLGYKQEGHDWVSAGDLCSTVQFNLIIIGHGVFYDKGSGNLEVHMSHCPLLIRRSREGGKTLLWILEIHTTFIHSNIWEVNKRYRKWIAA